MMLLLALFNMAAITDRMIFGALAPAVQSALRLGDAGLGLIQGPAFGIAYGIALPFAGRLTDRIGGYRTLFGSVLLWTAGLVVSAVAGTMATLVVGRAMTGIGQAGLIPAALVLILASIPPDRAGRAIGLFTGAGTIGRGLAFAVGGALLGVFGSLESGPLSRVAPWSAVLLTLAAGNLLLLVVIYGRMNRQTAPRPHTGSHDALRRWATRAPMSLGCIVCAALGTVVIVQALAAWVAIILVRGFAVAPATAAVAIGGIGIVTGPLGHLLGGSLADSPWPVGRTQAIVILLCMPAILLFARATTLPLAYAGLALSILLSGAAATIGLIRFQRPIPSEVRGSANGLFMALVALVGISGGPTLVSLAGGSSIADGLVAVVAGAALLSALAAISA